MVGTQWRIILGGDAARDFAAILDWTARTFGARQAQAYRDTLKAAIRALETGPDAPGSKRRDEIMPGLRTLHVARAGRRGRHFLMYRIVDETGIEIVRILHDAMDLTRHGSPSGGEPDDQDR